jgi:hypothetical protein
MKNYTPAHVNVVAVMSMTCYCHFVVAFLPRGLPQMTEDRQIEKLRRDLRVIDLEIARLEERRTAIVNQLDTFRRGWKPSSQSERARNGVKAGSTMSMVRDVLATLGKEATVSEIRAAIAQTFVQIPAPSLGTMLFREGSKAKSGIYRVAGPDRLGKYGLLTWRGR